MAGRRESDRCPASRFRFAGDFTVKFLIIVNESPWGSALAQTAHRFVHAALESGVEIVAVFFRGDGVYNAVPGEAIDAGTPDLAGEWQELCSGRNIRLLLCSSSRLRRMAHPPPGNFNDSGLTEMIELLRDSDRVVTF